MLTISVKKTVCGYFLSLYSIRGFHWKDNRHSQKEKCKYIHHPPPPPPCIFCSLWDCQLVPKKTRQCTVFFFLTQAISLVFLKMFLYCAASLSDGMISGSRPCWYCRHIYRFGHERHAGDIYLTHCCCHACWYGHKRRVPCR